MKVWIGLLVLLVGGAAWAADVKVVPKEVLTWYDDAMGMYVGLNKGLDGAKTAADASKALKKGTSDIKTGKLAPRYKTLKAKYPHFFDSQDDTTWVPPPDWTAVAQKYGKTLSNFSQGFQKIAGWMQDESLAVALQEFSEAAGEIGGDSAS